MTDMDPVVKLKLSDAFMQKETSGEFEWTATMINLNKGKNPELLSGCKALSEYMTLIEKIRHYQNSNLTLEQAVSKAIDECISEGILTDFLRKHRAEVLSVCITEFNEETYTKGIYEEGREQERRSAIERMLMDNKTPEQISQFCGYDINEVISIEQQLLQNA